MKEPYFRSYYYVLYCENGHKEIVGDVIALFVDEKELKIFCEQIETKYPPNSLIYKRKRIEIPYSVYRKKVQ